MLAYPDNVLSRQPILASGITDASLVLNVFYSGVERSLSLAELKKTGVEVINVKQYGAVGDGITDDTNSIKSAVEACENLNIRALYFPPGTYVVSDTISFVGTNTIALPNEFIQSFNIFGSGPQSTFIIADINSMPAFWFKGASHSRISDLWIANSSGDALRFSNSHRSYVSNIHCGRGTSDVCLWNDGSQQLRVIGCMFSPTIIYKGNSARAKYGIIGTSYGIIGSSVSGITNLDGLSLTLQMVSSATVTVSGNDILDVATAINSASVSTGIIACVDGDDRLILSTRTFHSVSGINDNYNIILSSGTGAWANAGHTSGTKTYGTSSMCSNAMSIVNTTVEQLGWAGVYIHAPKFQFYDRANTFMSNNVFQGNGYTSGPTYIGDVILDQCISSKITSCHLETSTGKSLQLNKAHNTTCLSSYFFDVDVDDTDNASFIGCTITGGHLDSSSTNTVMIANELYLTGGSYNKFSDEAIGTRWLAGVGNNAAGTNNGLNAYTASNTMSEVLNYNGKFEYWNGTSHPIGWDAANGATLTQSVTAMTGSYSVGITAASGTVNSGLRFTIPVGKLKHAVGPACMISITLTAKRTTASGVPGVVLIAGATQSLIPTEEDKSFPLDIWVTRRFTGYISSWASADMQIIITPSNTGDATASMLVDNVVITAGLSVPDQYMPMSTESDRLSFLQGKIMQYSSGIPSSGYYPQGSIIYSTSPSGGGYLGWVCTSGGTPGAWNTFGSISP